MKMKPVHPGEILAEEFLVSLEAIQKWDGKAPQTLVVGDGVKPLLNVK